MTRSPATDPGLTVIPRDGGTPEPREAPEQHVTRATEAPVTERPVTDEHPVAEGPSTDETPAVEAPATAEEAVPLSDNRRRAQRTAPLFAELATLEKDDPRRERLREILVEEHLPLDGTSPAGSATAASPSTTCCRSARWA